MYKVNKPKTGCAVSIKDRRWLNILQGIGVFTQEDLVNLSPAQIMVLQSYGLDVDTVVAGRGE